MDIIVAEGGIQVVVPLLSLFQPDEPTHLREFVVNRCDMCLLALCNAQLLRLPPDSMGIIAVVLDWLTSGRNLQQRWRGD